MTPKTALCFDLDATVTKAEILPAIAQAAGLSGDMAALTRAAMAGDIDFATSMRARCAVLAQVDLDLVHATIADIALDSAIVDFIATWRDDCTIITGNLDIWIAPLMEKIGCNWRSSAAHYSGGRLVVDHIIDKGSAARAVKSQKGAARLIAIGDGANDIAMFREAGLAIAFGGVNAPSPAVRAAAHAYADSSAALIAMLQDALQPV